MKKSAVTASIKAFEIKNPQNDINNQILLAKSEDSFIREVTVNAYESPSNATEIIWGSTNPELVGLSGYNKIKLSCYNNGKGMTREVLDTVTNFSSSNGKNAGIHGNKGKGEKLSGMSINSAGMVWVSCAKDPITGLRKVHRVVMIGNPNSGLWGKQEFFVEDDHGSRESTVVDITDIIDLEALELDIDKDWTLKIYCGVEPNQNTVENLYGKAENEDGTGARQAGVGKNSEGWLVRELSRRFPVLPENVQIKILHKYLTNDGKNTFLPVLNAIQKYADNTDLKFETVSVHLDKEIQNDDSKYSITKATSLGTDIPFFTENNTVSVTYVYDPHCGMKGNENKCTLWYKTRMGVTGVFSGLIFKNELYDFRGPQKTKGAPNWKGTAFDLGIIDGFDQFRVFVTLPNADHIVNDENRTKIIDRGSSAKDEFLLSNFRKVVQSGMPQWFRDIMTSYAPKVPDDKDLKEKYDKRLENWGQYRSARKDLSGPQTGISNKGKNKHQHTHDDECPACEKNGTVTVIPRGVRKCPVCGYIKPVSKGTSSNQSGLLEDPTGKSRTIKRWPDTQTFHQKTEWDGLNLCDNFEQMAAQYLYDDGKLYINATYPSFEKLTDLLLEEIGVDSTHGNFDEILIEASRQAENFIKDDCLCHGLFSAILKTNEPGFRGDDESWKRSVAPSVLSVYADHWMADLIEGKSLNGNFTNPLISKMKKWYKNRFSESAMAESAEVGLPEEVKNRWVNAGVHLPVEA